MRLILFINKKAAITVCSEHNVLNLQVIDQLSHLLTDVMVDLRQIETETKVTVSKGELIALFLAALNKQEHQSSVEQLHQVVAPTLNKQYQKGL